MDYKYKDQHFSVEIAEALLADVSTSGSEIATIREYLLRKHLESGGLGLPDSMDEEDGTRLVETALRNESKKAKTSRVHRNVWRIAKPAQWIFGEGKHWVYLYYFDQDKKESESKGKSVWRCKIGKTDGVDRDGKIKYKAPETRVNNQTRGAPVPPIIALLFRIDLHKALEDAIHAILTLQGKHLPKAQGNEWFRTNPSDVVHIVAQIDFGLLSPVYNLSPILEKIKSNEKHKTLNNTEIRLVSACLDRNPFEHRNRWLFMIGVGTGGCISELLSLTIDDVYQNGKPVTDLLFDKSIVQGGEVSRTVPANSKIS